MQNECDKIHGEIRNEMVRNQRSRKTLGAQIPQRTHNVVGFALLRHSGGRCSGRNRSRRCRGRGSVAIAVHNGLRRAIFRNMASLAATITSLAGRVQWTTVRSSAVARDVSEFTAGIAFHGLGLAITSVVVRASTLVAGGRTSPTTKSTTESTSITAARNTSATPSTCTGVGARSSKVTRLAAVIATATDTCAAQAQGRAVGLDVAQALAVITLFRLGRARMGAGVRFMALWDR